MIKSKILKKILSDDQRKLRKDGSPRKRFVKKKDEEVFVYSIHVALSEEHKNLIEERCSSLNIKTAQYIRLLLDKELTTLPQ